MILAAMPVAAWWGRTENPFPFPARWTTYGPCPGCQAFGVEADGDVWPHEIEAVLREHAEECPRLKSLAEVISRRADGFGGAVDRGY